VEAEESPQLMRGPLGCLPEVWCDADFAGNLGIYFRSGL
jgi:hypothetical protein